MTATEESETPLPEDPDGGDTYIDDDGVERHKSNGRSVRGEAAAKKIKQQKAELEQKLADNVADDLISRVAKILNHFPDTRNNDLQLALRFWEVFEDPSIQNTQSISYLQLKTFTRATTIVRARAKIQNDFKMFRAADAVRRKRRDRGEIARDVGGEPGFIAPVVHVYCDESGKTAKAGQSLVVGSVWIPTERDIIGLSDTLFQARRASGISKEFHFTEMTKGHVEAAKAYVSVAISNASSLAFKAIYLPRPDAGGRPSDDVIYSLHFHLLNRGLRHEIETGRAALPRYLNLLKDKDDGADIVFLADLRSRLTTEIPATFAGAARVDTVDALPSHESAFLQLADLFTGSVGRCLNREPDAPLNHKDDFARWFLSLLQVDPLTLKSNGDIAKVLRLD